MNLVFTIASGILLGFLIILFISFIAIIIVYACFRDPMLERNIFVVNDDKVIIEKE